MSRARESADRGGFPRIAGSPWCTCACRIRGRERVYGKRKSAYCAKHRCDVYLRRVRQTRARFRVVLPGPPLLFFQCTSVYRTYTGRERELRRANKISACRTFNQVKRTRARNWTLVPWNERRMRSTSSSLARKRKVANDRGRARNRGRDRARAGPRGRASCERFENDGGVRAASVPHPGPRGPAGVNGIRHAARARVRARIRVPTYRAVLETERSRGSRGDVRASTDDDPRRRASPPSAWNSRNGAAPALTRTRKIPGARSRAALTHGRCLSRSMFVAYASGRQRRREVRPRTMRDGRGRVRDGGRSNARDPSTTKVEARLI